MSDSDDLPSFLRDQSEAEANKKSEPVEVKAAPVDEKIHELDITESVHVERTIPTNSRRSSQSAHSTQPRAPHSKSSSSSSLGVEDPDVETSVVRPSSQAGNKKPATAVNYRRVEGTVVPAKATSLVSQALAIRQKQLKKAGVLTREPKVRQATTPAPRGIARKPERCLSAALPDQPGMWRPKYPYLSPQNLLKHDQDQQDERIRRKEDRERIEHNRLLNLALAREKEAKEQRDKQQALLYLAENAHQKEIEHPSYVQFPTIHSENSVAPWSRLQDKVWRPSGRLTKKKAEQLSALGYTSSSPIKEPNNSLTLRSAYGCVTDGGSEPSGVASFKSEPHQVTDFDPGKFERTTLKKKREREAREKEEKWSHIRLIQKKRSECITKIEARKQKEQESRTEEQQNDLVLSRAGMLADMESKKEYIAKRKETERHRREQVESYKEIRRKEAMERALQVRIGVLEDATKQSEFDYNAKTDELSMREAHRQALLKALGEQRKRHDQEQLAEEQLRHEVQLRDQQFALDQERQRAQRRDTKLARVRRNRDDAIQNYQQQKLKKLEHQQESDWVYDTLLKRRAPRVSSITNPHAGRQSPMEVQPLHKELAGFQRHNERFNTDIENEIRGVNMQQKSLETKHSSEM